MKGLIILATFLALCTAAQAKLAPLDLRPVALSADDTAIETGPSGATLESDYFRTPQMPYAAGRVFPCRLQMQVFNTKRLAQTCH